MHGGPSQVDTFDPKPLLAKYAGQALPASFGSVSPSSTSVTSVPAPTSSSVRIPSSSDIKVGVLTAIIGAPFFLYRILGERRLLAGGLA
jgi:hypothetical protein